MRTIRKTLIAVALALASGVASAHSQICLATTPLHGLNEVERVYFGHVAHTWGNPLLKSAAARAPVKKVPPMGAVEMRWERGGLPPFAFVSFFVTTATPARVMSRARRNLRLSNPVIRPLRDLDPSQCSQVILVATHH